MENGLIDVIRLQKEHGGILDAIGSLLNYLDNTNPSKVDQIPRVTERLTDLYRVLNEHIRFEEREVLPQLVSYAAEILAEGIVLEHEEILDSIVEITERSRDISSVSSDEIALKLFQAKFKEKMQDIRCLVEDHAQKQKMILELAEKTLIQDAKNRQ